MAQVNTPAPNLNDLFGSSSVMPLAYGLNQLDMSNRSTELNQAQALQDMLFQQQNDPLRLEAASLANTNAGYGNQLLQDKANLSRQTIGEQIAGAQSKNKKEISDNELSMLENSAQKMAMSRDPQERAVGVELLQHHKDIIRDRAKQGYQADRMLQQIAETGRQSRLTQQQAIDAGKYARGGSGTAQGVEGMLASGKLNYEKAATLLAGAAFTADLEGDKEAAARYRAMADDYNEKHIQSRQAVPTANQAGKVDTGAMTSLPTVPAKPVQGFQGNQPAKAAQPAKHSLADVMKSYPGIPEAKIKEAYKRKFGVDLE